MLKKRSACSRFVQAWVQPRLPRVSTVPCQAIIEVAVGGQGDQGAGSPLDHRQVALAEVESQPGSTSICARSRPSFECRPLPAITLADQDPMSGGCRAAAGQEGGAIRPDVGRGGRIAGGACPVSLDGPSGSPCSPWVHCSSPRPTAFGDGLICPKDGFASTASAQQRRHNFLPLPAKPTFRAEQESFSCAVQPLWGAPAFVSGRSIAIEAAMVRARKRKTET